MWAVVFLCLLQFIFCQGNDAPCHEQGGTCQENSNACAGGYQSNLCGGGTTRQCCLPDNDAPCRDQGGTCQKNSNPCAGGYQSNLCGGGATRQCCLPAPSNTCSGQGGTCQDDSLKCSGSYLSNLCSGGATNRCCLSSLREIDTNDCPNVKIISRDSWGARRPKTTSQLTSPVRTFFIHHTDSQACLTFSACAKKVKTFQNFHMDNRGWSDIGYSFLVGEDGNVYEGRGWTRVGAHTRCYNSVALAASMIGSFTTHLPNQAARDAVKALTDCGVTKNYITSDYSLHGHRDVNPTTCPGSTWYSELNNVWPNHFHKRSALYCAK